MVFSLGAEKKLAG